MDAGPGLERELSFLSGFNADGTVSGRSFASWNGDSPATYSDQSSQFKWGEGTAGTGGGTVTYAFDPSADFSPAERRVFLAGLKLWSDEANIGFVRAAPGAAADFTFERNDTGDAYEDDTTPPSPVGATQVSNPGNVVISIDTSSQAYGPLGKPFAFDAYPLSTVVHEEGHLIGLGHTGPYNGGTTQESDAAQFGVFDSQLYSVMSYISPGDPRAAFYDRAPVHGRFPNAETPMIADILAAQRIYGAPTETALSGGQTFGFNCNIADASRLFFDFSINKAPAVTLFDTGTHNTLDLSGFSTDSTVDLAPGSFSSCAGRVNNIAIDENTAINRVICGGGNDTITGTSGNDAIVGGAGNDIMTGGGGHDAYVFSPGFGQDQIVDFSVFGQDSDKLRFSSDQFACVGDALRHTSMSNGSATIHVDAQDSVTLLGVSRAELWSHPHAILLV